MIKAIEARIGHFQMNFVGSTGNWQLATCDLRKLCLLEGPKSTCYYCCCLLNLHAFVTWEFKLSFELQLTHRSVKLKLCNFNGTKTCALLMGIFLERWKIQIQSLGPLREEKKRKSNWTRRKYDGRAKICSKI